MKKCVNIKTWLLLTIPIIGFLSVVISCKNAPAPKNDVVIDTTDIKFINTASDYDAKFLLEAAEMTLEEVILGTLAQEKGTITHVKDLGKMIKEGHQKSLEELNELAKTKTITIPTAITDKGNEDYKNLNKNSGKEFDQAYSNMMVTMHKNAITLFEAASTNATDPHIRKWALDALPSLNHHLEQAMACQKETDH